MKLNKLANKTHRNKNSNKNKKSNNPNNSSLNSAYYQLILIPNQIHTVWYIIIKIK